MKRIMLIFVIVMMSITFVACNSVSSNSVNSHSDKITKIEIHREPNKMDYSDNDNIFDSTGMQLKIYYSGGNSTIISSGFTCILLNWIMMVWL